jgi:hypothetical protein
MDKFKLIFPVIQCCFPPLGYYYLILSDQLTDKSKIFHIFFLVFVLISTFLQVLKVIYILNPNIIREDNYLKILFFKYTIYIFGFFCTLNEYLSQGRRAFVNYFTPE